MIALKFLSNPLGLIASGGWRRDEQRSVPVADLQPHPGLVSQEEGRESMTSVSIYHASKPTRAQ